MASKESKKSPDAMTKLVDELLLQVEPSEILERDGLFSKPKKQLVERVLQKVS